MQAAFCATSGHAHCGTTGAGGPIVLGNNSVAVGKLAKLAGVSILGNATSSSSCVAAITAGANQVLVSNACGTAIGFGSVGLGGGGVTGVLLGAHGGTGVANSCKTITIGGNVTISGAFTFAGTITANTTVTFPTSGTLATTATTFPFSQITSTPTTLAGYGISGITPVSLGGTGTCSAGPTAANNIGAAAVAHNLSDLVNKSTARTNLCLGTAALKTASKSCATTLASVTGCFTACKIAIFADTFGTIKCGGTVTAGAIGALAVASNLSDLNNASTARTNLGLGTAAVKSASNACSTVLVSPTGSLTGCHIAVFSGTGGTIKDGGAAPTISGLGGLAKANNLSDVNSTSSARNNLGLGSSVTLNASCSSKTTLAAICGALTIGHLAIFADTNGTVKDGGAVPSSTIPTTLYAVNTYTGTGAGVVGIIPTYQNATPGTSYSLTGRSGTWRSMGVIQNGAAPTCCIGSGLNALDLFIRLS